MGRTRQSSEPKHLPQGVEVRYSNGKATSIRINFRYRGVQCREAIKLEPKPANIKYAANLRGEILNAIGKGIFHYGDYFPNSNQAKKFGEATPTDITTGELINDYLQLIEKTREYSTFISYRKICNAHLLPKFSDTPVKDLSHKVIREWIQSLDVTAKTLNNVLVPLRAVIDQAINDDIISKNPFDKIITKKLVSKEKAISKFKIDPFDKNEIQAILESSKGQIKNFLQFAFFTGLRISELIALEWDDIDWVNGIVHVSRAVVMKRVKGPKTAAGEREVLLLKPALDALQNQKQYTFLLGKRVFHNPSSNAPWETDQQIRKGAWKPLLRRCGVRYRNPYQTRHTYASMMLSSGENIMWTSRQMGHTDVETIIRRYGRWIPDRSVATGYRPVGDWDNHLKISV